jgi:hypothetical protein
VGLGRDQPGVRPLDARGRRAAAGGQPGRRPAPRPGRRAQGPARSGHGGRRQGARRLLRRDLAIAL